MDTADPSKTTHPGQQEHGVHLCKRCGWPFPKPLPSARHRRNHKRVCGTVPGYTLLTHHSALQTQYSALSSFSDDEHENGSDGDSKPPCVESVVSRGVKEGGSGRPLERMNMSSDDVFADAVSEFADASASLGGDEGLAIDAEIVSHKGDSIPDSTPGGNVQASNDHEATMKCPQEGTTTSPNQENATSFSEIPDIVEDPMTDPCEENKRYNAVEESDGLETGIANTDVACAFNEAPVTILVSKDSSESSDKVSEERTTKDHASVESQISQNEEKQDVKSGSETFTDNHFQHGETLLHSSNEISGIPVEDIPPTEFDKMLTDEAGEGSARATLVISEVVHVPSVNDSIKDALVSNQVVESGSEIERDISTKLSVDGNRAIPTAAEIETLEASLAHGGSGNGSKDSNEKDVISLTRTSGYDDTSPISKTDENGQVGSIVLNSNIDNPEDGYDKTGAVARDFLVKVEENVSENETKSDNLSLNISSSEGPVIVLPVVLVQSAGATSESESLQAEKAVQLPLDVNSSLGDDFTGTTAVIIKEGKLDDADPASEFKSVSHDVLLQKLEEDLSDDEPIESFPAINSSSQSIGNNQVDDSRDHEKSVPVSVTDAPYEINSPNGSSLDGNWGSVSVLSTISDAAVGDANKMKDPQGQSSDKYEMVDPPSSLTLIEPQAQRAAVASSTATEVQNPQQSNSAKDALFPITTNVPNDSHSRKKNEEIIAKVTNWSTGKQHSPLKTLLGEAKASSPNSNPSDSEPKDKPPVKNDKPVSTVNSILGSEEPDHPKEKLDSSGKEWSSNGRYSEEIKREKRKVKSIRPYWATFMCCSSVKKEVGPHA